MTDEISLIGAQATAITRSSVFEADEDLDPNPLDRRPLSTPDMPAVYILLGCLAVSGLVIIGILIYCTSSCWRNKCCKASGRRMSIPRIKISGTSHSELDRALAPHTLVDTMNGMNPPWMDNYSNNRSTRQRLLSHNSAGSGQHVGDSDDEEQYRQLRESDELSYLTGNYRISPTASMLDMNDPEQRSIIHYELGYEKTHMSCMRGTLTFALRYDFIHRVLMVHVIKAQHLPIKDRSGSSDPYFKMYLLPERRNHCKTRIYKKTLNPDINEMFSFDVTYNNLASRMLQFTAYDFDRFTRHDLIGNVIMRDLFERSDLYTWTEYTMHIIGSNEKDDFGDLLLQLSYSSVASKLTICVSKAYNLRPMDITGASDPYVKICQLSDQKRLKKKKTTIKRANLNPVYNETLTFELSPDQIDNTNFLVLVMDWDRIGSDDLLGCCILGPESPTFEGREQWRECMTLGQTNGRLLSPERSWRSGEVVSAPQNHSVARWHSLLGEVPEQFKAIAKRK